MNKGFLLPLICVLISASQGACQPSAQETQLYSDTSQFKSIEAVLNLPALKGKVVFIDLWGTRCGPCLEEFRHAKMLKERYTGKPVAFLYLKSPYNFDDTKEWKEMVERYDLAGINISMSINFYVRGFWERFRQKYPGNRMYGIPTYLIVNRQGKIVNFDAPRPSSLEVLFRAIDHELQQ